MPTRASQSADRDLVLTVGYAFDVDLIAGLDDRHLEDLARLLRTHASARQLKRLLGVVEDLLHQQSSV